LHAAASLDYLLLLGSYTALRRAIFPAGCVGLYVPDTTLVCPMVQRFPS